MTGETFLKEVQREKIFSNKEEPNRKKITITDRRKERFLEKRLHSVFWRGAKEVRDEDAT